MGYAKPLEAAFMISTERMRERDAGARGVLSTTIRMPQLGETVTEGTIARWLKQPGDRVEKYEAFVEVSTDKVNAEVPSPVTGTIRELIAAEGETVPTGAAIATIDEVGAEASAPLASPAPATSAAPTGARASPRPRSRPTDTARTATASRTPTARASRRPCAGSRANTPST
jgi:pyruvate/2-oxoglutarate dehydrogenase complex dihydrolipoamide acyltransferase (E2) component